MKRSEIVAKAREWLGTPFRHQGRSKGVGVDCVGLPLGVLDDLGVQFDIPESRAYSQQPQGSVVVEVCERVLRRKAIEAMRPGDLLIINMLRRPVHVAIVTDIGIIHAYGTGPRRVVEHALDAKWRKRVAGCFEVPGIED